MNETEILKLTSLVNSDQRIKRVHFSGGEPTLLQEKIKDFQSRISRKIEYGITTNGWLGDRLPAFLDSVQIDSIHLSYDKFHQSFIDIPTLASFITCARKRGIPVVLQFVFDAFSDLAEATPLIEAGAKMEACRLIRGGRAKRHNLSDEFVEDKNVIQRSCPSLRSGRTSALEKINYIPGSGFTPCCGPLVFDEMLPSDKAFSANLAAYSSNHLRSQLSKGSFAEVAKQWRVDLSQLTFSSECEACVWMHARRMGMQTPSVFEMLSQKEDTAYYPLATKIDRETETQIAKNFVLSYFLTCTTSRMRQNVGRTAASDPRIAVITLDDAHLTDVQAFVERNYYHPNASYYSDVELVKLPNGLHRYRKSGATGKIYVKNNEIVGAVLKNNYASHPALQAPTIHVGYWGYDRNRITREESQFIKDNWLMFLSDDTPPDQLLDCSIEWFNESSLTFAAKLGFEIRRLRLDKRITG